MEIAELQKLSLIDYPKKVSAIVFLFGCNFKCGFCHNPELVLPEKLIRGWSEAEVLDFLKKREKYLDGVCITGGEPLLRDDLIPFLKKIKEINYDIKIDTNGSFSEKLRKIVEKNLVDFIAMDIKADKENYDLLTGVEANLAEIEKSIEIIVKSGEEYEFRTTVIPGKHDEKVIENIGKWLNEIAGGKVKKFSIQNFIPRKGKMIDESYEKVDSFDKKELDNFKKIMEDYAEEVEVRE